jgi:hypothetical protein
MPIATPIPTPTRSHEEGGYYPHFIFSRSNAKKALPAG